MSYCHARIFLPPRVGMRLGIFTFKWIEMYNRNIRESMSKILSYAFVGEPIVGTLLGMGYVLFE